MSHLRKPRLRAGDRMEPTWDWNPCLEGQGRPPSGRDHKQKIVLCSRAAGLAGHAGTVRSWEGSTGPLSPQPGQQ